MQSCATCGTPLVLEINPDSSDEEQETTGQAEASKDTVPDDVQLKACGCHFHWQCLLDEYRMNGCPNCAATVGLDLAGTHQVLCMLENEGGLQEDLDIGPLLIEEAYLREHPEERRGRAFLEFCREGDISAIVDMISEQESDGGDAGDPFSILTFQNTADDGMSGLHAAILGQSQEVAWLLLFLASHLDLRAFPAEVLQEAESLILIRPAQIQNDIRSLFDSQSRTAEVLAAETGGVWSEWVTIGRLKY